MGLESQIPDIVVRPRYVEEIRKIFYKGGVGALFVFDLSKPSTWYHVIECYKEIEGSLKNIPFMVIGNLETNNEVKINHKHAENWVVEKGGYFIQINPKDTSLLETTFVNLIKKIVSISK